jgi:hypothetical protein
MQWITSSDFDLKTFSGGKKPETCPTKLFLYFCCRAGLPDSWFSNQKSQIFGKFWKALDWKMFIHFMTIWNIFWRFGIFYDHLVHLVHFAIIWYVQFSGFGIMYQEKSGNPAVER